jgi:alkanesulfonate monooxygenase SsuD/methylene tetrahydromethanopterin reductase-like flavin-dependent oxidoreductase (luciferase family)
LDLISGGRLDLGIGVGWQKEEYDASLVPWDGRFGHMDEQVRACKEFWRNAPASFHGDRINFDTLYSLPFPVQAGGIPIWYGVAPTERNFARIAELGDGWMPSPKEDQPAKFKEHVDALRAAFLARGRDPGSVKVQAKPRILRRPDGTPDIDATLAQYPAFAEAGATAIYVAVHNMCQSPEDYDSILDRLISVKASL